MNPRRPLFCGEGGGQGEKIKVSWGRWEGADRSILHQQEEAGQPHWHVAPRIRNTRILNTVGTVWCSERARWSLLTDLQRSDQQRATGQGGTTGMSVIGAKEQSVN
eukprot:scaffold195728_cov24-Tisochrysis_lutea.AAC.1